MQPSGATNSGLKCSEGNTETTPTPFSIKNLINIFEKQSEPPKIDVYTKSLQLNKSSSQKVSAAFASLQKSKDETKTTSSIQLEHHVSVKSLVYNFQKLSNAPPTVQNLGNREANQRYRQYNRAPSPVKLARMEVNSAAAAAAHKNAPPSPLFDILKVENEPVKVQSPIESESEKEESDDEAPAASGSYEFHAEPTRVSSESLEDQLSDDQPLGDGISDLPKSYKVVSQKQGHLEIQLPPPPKKTVLKKGKKKNTKNIKFKKEHEECETYNVYEYFRADEDLDVVGSTAEYELEKMLERMDKITFTITRESNQKLGLQVYGVELRTQNGKTSMAIYVKSVTPDSLCDRCGRIKVDDLIIEIDGVSMIGVEISKVSETIKACGKDIKFVVGREPNGGQDDSSSRRK